MIIILNEHELKQFEKKFNVSRRVPYKTKDGLEYIGKWMDNNIFINPGVAITSLMEKKND